MRDRISLAASLVCVSALVGAQDYRPAPRFEGKSIPDPPQQGRDWTAPETRLPRFLRTATRLLFEQGVSDPRGCEYREVEIGEGAIAKTHGWVLPARDGEAQRFVVTWNGMVYPAITVGEKADLDADVRALAEPKPQGEGSGRRSQSFFWAELTSGASLQSVSRLKVVMLLRLGRADLAETLFAAWTGWNRGRTGRDLTDYGVSYLTLAQEWAAAMRHRLFSAHLRGEDGIALDAGRRLSAFVKAAEAKADEMGFPRPAPEYGREGPGSYFQIGQLDELRADLERRAKMPPRTPIPPRGADPKARIAALIRDLDQIHVQQMSVPGSAYPGGHDDVRLLIEEGEPAVEPLLDALETDTRLTRSASEQRGGWGYSYVHKVYEAELAALDGLIPTAARRHPELRSKMPASRKELARALRADFEQVRGVPEAERWFRILADDRAEPGRWLEAAGWMTQEEGVRPGSPPRKPGEVAPLKGDSLRARRDPSVTELMVRRERAILAGSKSSVRELNAACGMGAILRSWDEPVARPIMKDLIRACREAFAAEPNKEQRTEVPVATFSQFVIDQAKHGDRDALDEYAAFIGDATPKRLEYAMGQGFEPMWLYPAHPSIEAASRTLFADPKSLWIASFRQLSPYGSTGFHESGALLISPLIRVPAFREAIIRLLNDRTELGTIARSERPNSYDFTLKTSPGSSGNFGGTTLPDPDAPGVGVWTPFRVCDAVAVHLASLDGTPGFATYWSIAKRDAAIAACARFLAKYGDRYEEVSLPGAHDWGNKVAHLKFPRLGRPATADEARTGVAIFSLEGRGEVRLPKMATFPARAQWVTNKDFPIDQMGPENKIVRAYDQTGWVWQAEEVRVGDRWERYYGFVGNSLVAQVPASEIEFEPEYFPGTHLPDGMDARISPEPLTGQLKPGGPAVFALHLSNRRGLPRTVPTEFLRDGKALRQGLTIQLEYLPKDASPGPYGSDAKWQTLPPGVVGTFEPGDTRRTLEAGEEFEAFRLDLAPRFDFSKPGFYRVTATFDEASGFGSGKVVWMSASGVEE